MSALPRPISDAFLQWLDNLEDSIEKFEALSSGSTNSARVVSRNGMDLFLKWRDDVIDGFFAAEAEGLAALGQQKSGLRIPKVHWHDENFVAIDYIATKPPAEADWIALGIGLARLHSATSTEFGFHVDTFCGPTLQNNKKSRDGLQFFAEQRLLPLTETARNKGLLQRKDCRAIESLCAQLPALLPVQPACLIHGDLWSGNALFAQSGAPVLIDPAAYHGWAEAELAMTTLFGGFDDAFHAEYQNHSAIDAQWRQRADIYNLYPLLNHLNLFGEGYLQNVLRIVKSFHV
jgi:protein-ribulosamine 3-kinase